MFNHGRHNNDDWYSLSTSFVNLYRLVNYENEIVESGIQSEIKIHSSGAVHPNTYRLTLKNNTNQHKIVALSKGGGMIEIIELDGIPVSIGGDYFETIIYTNQDGKKIKLPM